MKMSIGCSSHLHSIQSNSNRFELNQIESNRIDESTLLLCNIGLCVYVHEHFCSTRSMDWFPSVLLFLPCRPSLVFDDSIRLVHLFAGCLFSGRGFCPDWNARSFPV